MKEEKEEKESKSIDLLEYEDKNLDFWSQTWADENFIFVNMGEFSFVIPVETFSGWVEFLNNSFKLYVEKSEEQEKRE
jgi:hypothetical protein